jgi:hypothetical protein
MRQSIADTPSLWTLPANVVAAAIATDLGAERRRVQSRDLAGPVRYALDVSNNRPTHLAINDFPVRPQQP